MSRKGIALPVEYLVILIIAIVVLLAVVVWYLYFWPKCPDPQFVLTQACRGWSLVNCKDENGDINLDYSVPDALVPDKRCVDADGDGHLTMEEVCSYAGLSDIQCAKQCGCKV